MLFCQAVGKDDYKIFLKVTVQETIENINRFKLKKESLQIQLIFLQSFPSVVRKCLIFPLLEKCHKVFLKCFASLPNYSLLVEKSS